MRLKRKLRKGFTLVELVVVIAVIAILAAVSVGAYFGVTDSANASAAEQYKKQIKDLWIMYSVSQEYVEGNSDETIIQNAEYFCMTYAKDNGPQNVIVNYRLIDINPSFSVSGLKDSTYTTTGVMFFIDSNYDTYFVTNGARIVIESDLIKSEDSFKNSMTEESTSFMSQEDRDTFKTLGFGAFELSNVGSEEEPVLGYKYFIVNVDGDLPYNNIEVPVNRSLASVKEQYKPNDVGYNPSGSNIKYFGKTYEITENGVEVDTTIPFTHDHQTPVLIEGNKYSVGTINLTYTKLLNETYVNLYNFPICDYVNGKATYYKNFVDFKTNPNFANSEDTATHYIFVGNTSLNVDLTLPSNYNLIVEYSVNATSAEATATNVASMQSFINLSYDTNNIENTLADGRYTTAPSTSTVLTSKIEVNDWKFTIKKNVQLCVNGLLLNEAYSLVANSNNSTMTQKACHIYLEEGSKIIIEKNAKLRSLGLIDGSGSIIVKNGGTIIETFKVTSFLGGTITGACVSQKYFPFMDYKIDNLRVSTKIEYGAFYKSLAYLFMANQYSKAIVPLVGSDSLFILDDSDSHITKSYDLNSDRTNLNIEGKVIDGNFKLTIYNYLGPIPLPIKLDSCELNFPISNMNIFINNGSKLSLKASSGRYYSHYEVMPSSSLTNYGHIEVGDNNKLVIANIQNFDGSAFGNPVAKKVMEKYNMLKDNDLFINNGAYNKNIFSYESLTGYSHNSSNSYSLKFLSDNYGSGSRSYVSLICNELIPSNN